MKEKIVKAVGSPLGFYVLSLLVVEVFLGIVLIQSELTEMHQFYGLIFGVGLFIIVVGIVSLFVWCRPSNLVFDSQSRLIESGKLPPYGDDREPATETDIQSQPPSEDVIQTLPLENPYNANA